ncbi:MAG: TolC family protein [Panacagrimonas sp.]
MFDHPLRKGLVALCLTAFVGGTAQAQDEVVALELEAAQALSVTRQPLLDAQSAAVQAARESAVAAGQLPDPKLTGGIRDLPIEGRDRYSLSQDDFTMYSVGVMQEFPRAEKRRLLGARGEHEADLADQMLIASRLEVRRDAGLAWLEVWQSERAAELARASVRESGLQLQATQIAYTAGTASQSDVLAARVATAMLRDDLAGLEQSAQVARGKLSRWIGAESSQRLLCPELPAWAAPPTLEAMLTQLRSHPHLNAQARRVAVAQDEVALAEQAYKPDWGVELEYANRPDFADYVSLNFSIDLPVFSANRQDRGLAAKLSEQTAAEQTREDTFRQEEAELRQNWSGWQRLQERLRLFEADILPQSEQRIAVAVSAWKAGQGSLAAVLEARRMALDARMKHLELVTDAARLRLNLLYFAGA